MKKEQGLSFDADDPRLSAYALGELDAAEMAEVERLLARSEEARALVEELRSTGAALAHELAKEPALALSDAQRDAIARRSTRLAPARRRWVWLGAAAAGLLAVSAVAWFATVQVNRSSEVASRELHRGDPFEHPAGMPAPASAPLPRLEGLGYSGGSADPSAATEDLVLTASAKTAPSFYDENGDLIEAESTTPSPFGARRMPIAPKAKGRAGGRAEHLALRAVRSLDDEDDATRVQGGLATEQYHAITENAFKLAAQDPLSTFSIDVDTASYANLRRFLNQGQRPPADAIRVEELLNYFRYDYPRPSGDEPFSVSADVATCPWAPAHELVRVGLRGKEIDLAKRQPSNLVFLIDVSGSMDSPDKLPLLVRSMKLLVEQLDGRDRLAMVVYAGASGVVLPSTTCDMKSVIVGALDSLHAGGSTNGAAGIELAYQLAAASFTKEGQNRVILCTDGDFNVGVTDEGSLTRLIEAKRATGVFLSVLGFGTGNVKDSTMEMLADKGNGQYAYVDTLAEAQKVLVSEMGATLFTIAKDVKIQVEFNPTRVQAFRLIGYENRVLAHQDFNDDKKDAGEIGAGHQVTALYEVVPVGAAIDVPSVDPLRYQTPAATTGAHGDELLLLKLRYKQPDGDVSKLIETPVRASSASWQEASADFKFAAAVAGFGMVLRESKNVGAFTLQDALNLAVQGVGEDVGGYRKELVELVRKAMAAKTR